MPIAKAKKPAEESKMAPIVFQLPAEFAEKISGRLGESDKQTGESISELKRSLSELGSSIFRARMEHQTALLQHKKASKQELTKHKSDTDQVVKELEEAFAVLWPKFETLEKSIKEGDETQGDISKKNAKDLAKQAEEVLELSKLVERRYQSALKKVNIAKGEVSDAFSSEVKRIDKLIKAIGKYEYGSSLNVLAAGSPVGFTGVLNFKSGFTVALNGAQIDVSASGGGFTSLDPTQTPNGVRSTFTFASAIAKPSYIISDGVWMKATSKAGTVNWTWSGTTATMTIPPTDDIEGVV